MPRALSLDELLAVLDAWTGSVVAVRIMSPPDELVAIFEAPLGGRSEAKSPSMFWPLGSAPPLGGAEQPRVYVHPGLVDDAYLNTGESVAEWRQAGSVVNVRRL